MKIAFISIKSLLDINSGAALELKLILESVARTDAIVMSFTLNCYDIGDSYVADEAIDQRLSPSRGRGQLFHYDLKGVRHYMIVGGTKDTMKISRGDLDRFLESAAQFIQSERPSHIVFFGSNELMPLLRLAKAIGSKVVFYVGTASYGAERKPLFEIADKLVAPSQFIAQLYRERFNKSAIVIPTTVPYPIDPPSPELTQIRQHHGFLTLINPAPDKGGHFVIKLAQNLSLCDRLFLCVESRSTREFWKSTSLKVDNIPNLLWAPWQHDIRLILKRTAVLLMPSLIDEAAGKVISEAMSLGVPCVGFDRGGVKEQIGNGGIVLPFDERLAPAPSTGNYNPSPDVDIVEKWAEVLLSLLKDEEEYSSFSSSALIAAERFQVKNTLKIWLNDVFH